MFALCKLSLLRHIMAQAGIDAFRAAQQVAVVFQRTQQQAIYCRALTNLTIELHYNGQPTPEFMPRLNDHQLVSMHRSTAHEVTCHDFTAVRPTTTLRHESCVLKPFALHTRSLASGVNDTDDLSHLPYELSQLSLDHHEEFSSSEGEDMEELAHLQGDRPIDKYLGLRTMRHSQPYHYFRLLMRHQEEVLPYIYTPTVGEACQHYHELPIDTDGLYISLQDRGSVADKLAAWPERDIRVIVVTDGERILGLGDLGANGMGISEGKITLYTAAAGVSPSHCLPVCLDMGTNNAKLLADPKYKGLRQARAKGQTFDDLLAEFMAAVKTQYPHCVVQFEDFGNTNAFRLLEQYRHRQCCFNDDIQGTAAITLAAVLAALRGAGQGGVLAGQRVMFLGAGEAGTGIGQLMAYSMHRRGGMTLQAALRHCFFVDSKGLVCKARQAELQEHKLPFAHDVPFCRDLKEAVERIRPTVLIGVSTVQGAFTEEIVKMMADFNEHPIIMPLSNPTSKAEVTFEQAYKWSNGKVIFASGSPFSPIISESGVTIYPAQANNAYIFPAIGHAASLQRWPTIPDDAFLLAAEALAGLTTQQEIRAGRLFPPFSKILDVSATIMAHLLAGINPEAGNSEAKWKQIAQSHMWSFSTLPHEPHHHKPHSRL